MKKAPFILKALSIQKMPGFPRGLEDFDNLATNINIIAGPNASGKSSTARGIQQLIWHNKTKGLVIEGSVEIDDEAWEIKIDSDNIKIQHDGKDEDLSGLPAVEECNRYMLALHELVIENEGELAREIIKQSIGGYDLDSAKVNLQYSPAIKNKASSEFKALNSAENKYKDIRKNQRELKKEEEKLTDLHKEKEESQQAFKLNGLYEKVVEYLKTKLEHDQLSEKFKEFSNSLEKVTGEEYSNIEDLEQEIEDDNEVINGAKNEIQKSKEVLEGLKIPEDGISDLILTELEERIEKLTELDRKITDKEEKIEEYKTKEIEAINAVDKSIDPSEWEGINLKDIGNLDKFLQDANQLLGEKEFLLTEIDALKKEIENFEDKTPNLDKFVQGIKTLSEWLKEQSSTIGIPRWTLVVLSILGIGTAIATGFMGWQGLLGSILIVGLLIYTYLSDNNKDKTITSKIREQDFTKTGLTPPIKWDTENVSGKLDELVEELETRKWLEKFKQRLKDCDKTLLKLQNQLDQLNNTRDEWVEKLKAAPEFPPENSKDFSSLYWYIKHISDWQNAHTELEALKAQNIQLQTNYENELDKINEFFTESKVDKAKDVIEAKTIYNKLRNEETTRRDEIKNIKLKEELIGDKEKQKTNAFQKLTKIYEKLNIESEEKEKVRLLLEQLTEYKRIVKELYAANEKLSERESLLKAHSLFKEYEQIIKGLSIDQAQEKVAELTEIAERLEGINEEITRIETLIQNAQKGHELEDVLTEKEEALNNLEQLYENNLSSLTGNLIIDQLKKETREQNRPKVYKRANELLNRITNGRYELRLEEKEDPAFRAYDTVLKLGQELAELSTATRVQLLLSIRLAFVETQEPSIKLPLLADELLANSDDERAKAIIESLIEISKEGRQVFYFTAQADEVGKWNSFLGKQSDIKHAIFQLKRSKKTPNYVNYQTNMRSFSLVPQVPTPNGKNYDEYRKEIQVEPYDILVNDCNQLHLWYLLNDIELLYNCLNRGIRYWGQLESFLNNNGKINKLDEDTKKSINNKIRLLERFQELYQKGRSKPIDREVLEYSGAISGSYIDAVSNKLKELNGNPKRLIEELRNGEISGFRHYKIDEFEQYLLNEEYLDYHEPVEKEDILVQLNAMISYMDMDISDAEGFINRVLQQNFN